MKITGLGEDSRRALKELLARRSPSQYGTYADTVNEIVESVRKNGDAALFAYTERFDGCKVTRENVLVTEEEIAEAY